MAATPLRPAPAGGAPSPPDERFDTRMRFEWADPEQRTLVWSWVVAVGLAIIWLIVVSLYNVQVPELLPPGEVSIQLKNLPEPPPAPAEAAVPQTGKTQPIAAAGPKNRPAGRRGERGKPTQGRPGSRTETNRTGAISDAFGTGSGAGTGGLTGDVSGILRGVAVASGGGGTGGGRGGRGGGGAGGKMVLGYGQGGEGGTTPGRGGFGGGAGTGGGGGGGGIGGVGAGGGISRATVRVQAPRAIASPGLGPAGRDVGELGDYVRSRESQLRFCYQEYGLKSDPSLAGTINVAITMTGSGSVTGVDITNRTWGGPGAAPTESCIRSKISGWHFPASSAGGGTYSFPFNFTK